MSDADGRPDDAAPPAHEDTDVIMGVGASVRGLEPLEAVLRRFTVDHRAFVVVQRFPADPASLLAETLTIQLDLSLPARGWSRARGRETPQVGRPCGRRGSAHVLA